MKANLHSVGVLDSNYPQGTLLSLADTYGPIYQLRLPNGRLIVCSSVALVDELADEKRFVKEADGALFEIRNVTNDSLFTVSYA